MKKNASCTIFFPKADFLVNHAVVVAGSTTRGQIKTKRLICSTLPCGFVRRKKLLGLSQSRLSRWLYFSFIFFSRAMWKGPMALPRELTTMQALGGTRCARIRHAALGLTRLGMKQLHLSSSPTRPAFVPPRPVVLTLTSSTWRTCFEERKRWLTGDSLLGLARVSYSAGGAGSLCEPAACFGNCTVVALHEWSLF